ncbi:hypothetical protein BGW36DRAFT_345754 [Talaromyces proteolyticus]|uniref:C2 domain-containing protein n=1 Tax=Talaromyces proteolyticus TaxID=1131652 RepID=A0AAD4PY07_9EURO|nr:uncharacterized protein BGW36DRAFT_345754 [Talaromyces proteolyticus]KAH8693894.1 hypothetical protein BGW36DRAFT_345754 [Talaromyces proteolyticus]
MASKPVKLPSPAGHTAGIYADMSVDGPQIGTLVVIFDRAKNLPNRKTIGKQNPYVAARLGKEAKKTETDMRGGQTPRWDQEIRFTVHESPDYFQLKISVFNDDKKTDLIGETWVDLHSLIIPGGSQSDSWHELKFKNKYAGDIRMEMTYYDTRPEDEAVIERRTVVPEKTLLKSSPVAPGGSSTLSGPRQFRPVKRRPLPEDPTGAPASRAPVVQEYPPPAPVNSMPPRPQDYGPPPSTSSRLPPEMHPSRVQSNSNDRYVSENNTGATQDQHAGPYYQSYQEPRHAYNDHRDYPPGDYNQQRQLSLPEPSNYPHDADSRDVDPRVDPHGGNSYDDYEQHSRHSPHQYSSTNTFDNGQYSVEPLSHPPGSRSSQAQSHVYPVTPQAGPVAEQNVVPVHAPTHVWQDRHRQSPLRHHVAAEERPTYAAMQPTVEDENDEGPPPPPPVHRSSASPAVQRPAASPTYKPYSQEYGSQNADPRDYKGPSAILPADQDIPLPIIKPTPQGGTRAFPEHPDSVPSSLIAGYVGTTTEVDTTGPGYPDYRVSRVPVSAPPQTDLGYANEVPQTQTALQPLRRSPAPAPAHAPMPNDESHIHRKSPSVSPSPRPLSYRKSISPRPPSRDNREVSSIPFSPDSFDSLNPRRSPSATRETRSRYETPEREMDNTKYTDTGMEDVPIIGDDGRVIDPSDHLPSETWAPEPEKKKKPEVIIRFKHNPQNASYSARSSPREYYHSNPTTPESTNRHTVRPWGNHKASPGQQSRQAYDHSVPTTYTPPRPGSGSRDYDRNEPYSHQRNHSTPVTYNTPSRHRSVSPNPSPQGSPLYSYGNSGPPIPAKVPIATPVSNNYHGSGMDALSQEIQSIDIGSGVYEPSRAVRKYAPRVPVTTSGGYR